MEEPKKKSKIGETIRKFLGGTLIGGFVGTMGVAIVMITAAIDSKNKEDEELEKFGTEKTISINLSDIKEIERDRIDVGKRLERCRILTSKEFSRLMGEQTKKHCNWLKKYFSNDWKSVKERYRHYIIRQRRLDKSYRMKCRPLKTRR